MQLGVFAVIAVSSSVAIGYRAGDKAHSPDAAAQRAWHGKISKVARAGADKTGGVTLKKGKAESPGIEGAEVSEGTEVVTDARTRVRIDLDDGSSMVLDRGTQIAIESGPRAMRVKAGSIVADVAHIENAPIAHLTTEHGEVGVLGTKFALTSAEDRTTVEVMRGVVELKDASSNHVQVGAGQEGVASKNAKLEIAPVNDLAQRLAFGERLGLAGAHNEDTDLPVSGLGELRARRPGKTDEKDHAVALSSHNVKVRIVGNVARTEVDEIFTNETNDELEGVYRFPLPPDAQIERLALEVDGKLIEGSFVDKAKGAAIFRGAIQNATPKAPKPKEEIIWVPGPWHDPALLEWQRGGRFELRIFPIPKHGARRVVIAYTETVAPVAGTRRYVYPLPQSTSSEMRIGSFGVDVQVLGADPKLGVKAKGYEVAKAATTESGGERFAQTMTNFVPSGDLTIEYGLADRATDVTAWGYTDPLPRTAGAGADKVLDKGYVALALRPKLPGWTESKPRDVVIVVDSGRAMFGERYQRAKRLAVQVTQEMDRRDRVAVLACDVTCRAMPGGFDGAGSKRAHDVDAFLAGNEPDGATDLVGAVRAAAGIGGHDRTRDLRVVLVSDGIASAGYRRPERLSNEIQDVLTGGRDEVIAVPIGADADVLTLKEIARGGGGVVVPYSPGEMLETAALEVLNATYGITLRDVELTLPAGLAEAAPSTIAPIRAGGETIVTARLTGESVKGDAILRGKVGGQPFEARYPIDVQATSDAGNAFVPRLYAAARIADKERETNESSRVELVSLSQRYAVPSRFTSLLVLESEAMFNAFGIDRSERSASWTGEAAAHGSEVATLARDEEESSGALGGDLSKDKKATEKADDSSEPRKRASLGDPLESSLGGTGSGFGGGGSGRSGGPMQPSSPPMTTSPAAKPAPTMAPPPPADARAELSQAARRPAFPGGRGGRFMKRVWFRKATLSNGAPPAVASDKIALARAAVQAAPDERAKYKELVRLLSANGALDELGEVLARWASRDPLDPDAIAARADLSARSGDRERSLRILDGIASGASSASSDVGVIEALALAHERAGDRFAACAFRIAAAEVRSDAPASALGAADVDRFARAVACERADGRPAAADRWLASRKDRSSVETAALRFDSLAKGAAAPTENTGFGDIVVDATWDSAPGVDVDVAVVDPAGNRLGWSSRSKNVRVTDATSRRHETLAISNGSAGAFTVELARAGGGTSPVTGTLSVRSLGERISVPFVLSGPVVQAARVQVRFESELVPADGPPEMGFQAPPFDRGAAVRALAAVSVVGCSTGSGPTGEGIVRVTFGPTGRVISASVVDAPFIGTSTGACVAGAYRRAMIPAFDTNQGSVTLQKGFVVPP